MKPVVLDEREERLEKFNFLLIIFLFIFFCRNICKRERGGGRLEKFWFSFDNFLIYFYLMFLKFKFKFVELETFCFGWEREERRQIGKVSIFLLLWIKNFIWTHLFLSICNLNLNLWKLKPFVLDPKEDWRQIGKVSLNRRWTLYMYEETAIVNVVKSKWLNKSGYP